MNGCLRLARFGPFVLLLLACGACSVFNPSRPAVPDSTLVNVLVDLHLAAARMDDPLYTDLPAALRDSILSAHGLDSTRFDATTAYYADHPAEYLALYDTLIDRLLQRRSSETLSTDSLSSDSLSTDSLDLAEGF